MSVAQTATSFTHNAITRHAHHVLQRYGTVIAPNCTVIVVWLQHAFNHAAT
jgi:hypothetical protein